MNSEQLNDVLDDYIQQDSPQYAMMINGLWGCGKTHFLKKSYPPKNGHKLAYVSLYGVSSYSQIEDEIFSAIIGIDGISESEIKKAGDFLGKVASAIGDRAEGSAIGAFASTLGSSIKNRVTKNIGSKVVLVFDDLERASIDASKCLSKINEYVEHLNAKVIILCDETKIKETTYWEYKEKVVLYTNHLERTATEVVDICFSNIPNFKSQHIDGAKAELTYLVEQCKLTNIRTVQHALNCFAGVIDKLHDINFPYIENKIIYDLLFPCIAFSVGYRDMQVPVEELEKTAKSTYDLALRYHMKSEDRKEGETKSPKTNWELFYTRILNKSNKEVSFSAIFELVCKGYLDFALLEKDIKNWNLQEHGAEYPITNFRVDINIDEQQFQQDVENAIALLDKKDHTFQSTESLFAFCSKFHLLYVRSAFDYSGDFEAKLNDFAQISINNCINQTEMISFHKPDKASQFVNELFESLNQKSGKLRKEANVKNAQQALINALENSEVITLDEVANQSSIVIFDSDFTKQLLKVIDAMPSDKLRLLGIFLNERYNTSNIFDFLNDEIQPLLSLHSYLLKLVDKSPSSMKKYMLLAVLDSLKDIDTRAKAHIKKELK
jgi:predicted RNA-binding protein with PIN domain